MRADPLRSSTVVIDASVAVEFLLDMDLSAGAAWLFETALERDVAIYAPDLLFVETASAIRRLRLAREISSAAAASAIAALARLPIAPVGAASLVTDAWNMHESVTIYDAIYATLARRLATTLVTGDRKLQRALRARGHDVVALRDVPSAS